MKGKTQTVFWLGDKQEHARSADTGVMNYQSHYSTGLPTVLLPTGLGRELPQVAGKVPASQVPSSPMTILDPSMKYGPGSVWGKVSPPGYG